MADFCCEKPSIPLVYKGGGREETCPPRGQPLVRPKWEEEEECHSLFPSHRHHSQSPRTLGQCKRRSGPAYDTRGPAPLRAVAGTRGEGTAAGEGTPLQPPQTMHPPLRGRLRGGPPCQRTSQMKSVVLKTTPGERGLPVCFYACGALVKAE